MCGNKQCPALQDVAPFESSEAFVQDKCPCELALPTGNGITRHAGGQGGRLGSGSVTTTPLYRRQVSRLGGIARTSIKLFAHKPPQARRQRSLKGRRSQLPRRAASMGEVIYSIRTVVSSGQTMTSRSVSSSIVGCHGNQMASRHTSKSVKSISVLVGQVQHEYAYFSQC